MFIVARIYSKFDGMCFVVVGATKKPTKSGFQHKHQLEQKQQQQHNEEFKECKPERVSRTCEQ